MIRGAIYKEVDGYRLQLVLAGLLPSALPPNLACLGDICLAWYVPALQALQGNNQNSQMSALHTESTEKTDIIPTDVLTYNQIPA